MRSAAGLGHVTPGGAAGAGLERGQSRSAPPPPPPPPPRQKARQPGLRTDAPESAQSAITRRRRRRSVICKIDSAAERLLRSKRLQRDRRRLPRANAAGPRRAAAHGPVHSPGTGPKLDRNLVETLPELGETHTLLPENSYEILLADLK